MEVIAYRDIHIGEEITISYSYLGMPSAARRKFLHDNWGFEFSCPLCRDSEVIVAHSDNRRERILELRRQLARTSHSTESARRVEILQEIITLLDVEGLSPLKANCFQLLAETYLDINDI